jgi:hypothetical protein
MSKTISTVHVAYAFFVGEAGKTITILYYHISCVEGLFLALSSLKVHRHRKRDTHYVSTPVAKVCQFVVCGEMVAVLLWLILPLFHSSN